MKQRYRGCIRLWLLEQLYFIMYVKFAAIHKSWFYKHIQNNDSIKTDWENFRMEAKEMGR